MKFSISSRHLKLALSLHRLLNSLINHRSSFLLLPKSGAWFLLLHTLLMAKYKEEEDDKPDGLEIISIGSLYSGPWDKKYWSSSRVCFFLFVFHSCFAFVWIFSFCYLFLFLHFQFQTVSILAWGRRFLIGIQWSEIAYFDTHTESVSLLIWLAFWEQIWFRQIDGANFDLWKIRPI